MKHSSQPLAAGKSPLIQPVGSPSLDVGKRSRVDAIQQPPSPVASGSGQHLISDGAQLEASMQRTVAAVTGRSAHPATAPQVPPPAMREGSGTSHVAVDASSSSSHEDPLEAELEETLAGLHRSLDQMGQHLAEARRAVGGSPAVVAPPSPTGEEDGEQALANLKAALERMRETLGVAPEPEDDAPEAPEAPEAPAARSYDVPKRVFKALSYGGAALGTVASFAGWVASKWAGTKIQQTSQTAGGLSKNVLGATGDYFDMKEKLVKADKTAADGGQTEQERQAARWKIQWSMGAKIGGQLVSAIGQATSMAGLLIPGAGPARAVGAGVNGLGMLIVAVGEFGQDNRAKAAAGFAGAACNFIGMGGYILSADAQSKAAKEITEALLDVGADSNAWTPIGGAVDDAAKSKAAGANRRQKLRNDPKPRGQAVNGVGAWLNFVASVLNRRSESVRAEGDLETAGALKIAAIAIGGFANTVSTYGNFETARGEAYPVTAPPPDVERGDAHGEGDDAIELRDRAPAAAT